MGDQDLSGLSLSQICDEAVLRRFMPERSIRYYQPRFARLATLSGLGDAPLAQLSAARLRRALAGVPARSRLPWTELSLFNWSAFFATILWSAWRRVTGCWWLVVGFGLASAAMLALQDWFGISAGKVIGLVAALVIGSLGTELFFLRIVGELSTGRIRAKRSRWRNLILAAIVMFVPAFLTAALDDTLIGRKTAACNQGDFAACDLQVRFYTSSYGSAGRTSLANAYFNRGVAYWRKDQLDAAIDNYTQSLKVNPKNARAYYNRGIARARKGSTDDAIGDFNAAAELEPGFMPIYQARSSAYEKKGDAAHAIADLEQAIRLNPKLADPYNNLGLIYLRIRRPDLAVETLEHAVELNASSATAHNSLGYAYRIDGQLDQAVDSYSKAIGLRPDYLAPVINRAVAFTIKGDPQQALGDYTAARRMDPKSAIAIYGAGYSKVALGDAAGGEADMRAASDIRPDVAKTFQIMIAAPVSKPASP